MRCLSSLLTLFAAAVPALISSSCGTSEEAGKKEEMRDTVIAAPPAPEAIDSADFSYALPSTLQIANIFKKSGLSYYSGITNNVDQVKTYKAGSQFTKAVNLGVYSADLSYCILNKQSEESKHYFKACKELASELGLSRPFEGVAKRMEKNLDNQDSLAMILVAIQMETDEILSSTDAEYISIISFTGAWIESMYIGTKVHAKEGHIRIADKLVEQMGIAENIIKALRANRNKNEGIDGLIRHMESLNDLYNSFEAVKEIKAADPDVIDPTKVHIGVKELYSFSQRVQEIRETIVKG